MLGSLPGLLARCGHMASPTSKRCLLGSTGLRTCLPGKSWLQVLVLVGTDRLDRPLTIGQMQGKFQPVLLPQVKPITSSRLLNLASPSLAINN